MGIGNEKITKLILEQFTKKTIAKGIFSKFAKNFYKDVSSKTLDGLTTEIKENNERTTTETPQNENYER